MAKLMTTQELIDCGRIPPDLVGHILVECPYCHLPIIRDTELRSARCADFMCFGHVRHRADNMCKKLGIVGMGPERCGDLMTQKGVSNHVALLPYLLPDKPALQLWQIADIAEIPGYGTKLEEMFAGYSSFEHYFSEHSELSAFKRYLLECEQYFTVKPPLSKNCISIMIHGSLPGFGNRSDLVPYCNNLIGDVIRVKEVGANHSADYLVTEDKTAKTRKCIIAHEYGIPILTAIEFEKLLACIYAKENNVSYTPYINEGEEDTE